MVHKPGRMPLTASHRRDKLNFPGCSCQSLYGVCSSLLLTHLSYSCNNIELLNATKKKKLFSTSYPTTATVEGQGSRFYPGSVSEVL